MIFMILFRILLTALIIIALWCLMLLPRRGQSGWEKLTNTRYAHRGLHDITRGIPENSMAAFRKISPILRSRFRTPASLV